MHTIHTFFEKTSHKPSKSSKASKVKSNGSSLEDKALINPDHDPKHVPKSKKKTAQKPAKKVVEQEHEQIESFFNAGKHVELKDDQVYRPGSSSIKINEIPGKVTDLPELDFSTLEFEDIELGETVGADQDVFEDAFPWLSWIAIGTLVAAGLAALLGKSDKKDPEKSAVNDFTVVDDVPVYTGTLVSGAVTNDTKPTISGTGEVPQSTVTVYIDGSAAGTVLVNSSGGWTFEPTTPLTEAQHTIATTIQEPGKTVSDKTPIVTITIDTTSPEGSTSLNLYDDEGLVKQNIAEHATIAQVLVTEHTDDQTPVYSGKINVSEGTDAKVVVYDNGKAIATVPVSADGSWTFTPALPLSGVEHIFTNVVIDKAGNTSATSKPWAFIIDAAAPAEPVIVQVLDDLLNKTGALQQNDSTNDGTLIISGTGTASTIITVFSNNVSVGTTIVGADGKWVLSPTADLGGDGLKNITAQASNTQGQKSTTTGVYPVILDRTSPDVGDVTLNDNVGAVTGQIKDQTTTDDRTPTLTGKLAKAESGAVVSVFMDGVLVGTTMAGSDGTWTYDSAVLANGVHKAEVQITDLAGNTSVKSAAINFTIDAAGAVAVDYAVDNVLAKTGNVSNGGVTNDNTPELVGSAPAKSTITITDPKGVVVTTVADANGVWKATVAAQPDGEQTFKVASLSPASVAGNATFKLAIDTTAPKTADPLVKDDVGRIQGTVAKYGFTDDITPTIQGENAEPNHTVMVYDRGAAIGSVTVKPDGTWSFTPDMPGLSEGLHDFTVIFTDPAGNTSAASASYPFTIDVTKPGVLTGLELRDDDGDVKGLIANNLTIAEVTQNEYTDDLTPIYSGSAPSDSASVIVYDHGVEVATVPVGADGKWSYTPATALLGKEHIFTAAAIDKAGNVGAQSAPWAFVLNVDAIPPVTITQVTDDQPLLVGKLEKNMVTNDDTLIIDGKFAPSTSDTNTWIVHVLVNGTEVGTTKTDSAGLWKFTTPSLGADGTKIITAYGVDPTGKKTDATDVFTVILDRTPPGASTTTLIDNVGAVTGAIANNSTTDDTTPTVTGKADPKDAGGTVTITLDGLTHTAIIATDGTWTYTPTTPLTNGKHEVFTQVTDPAGNTGSVSLTTTFTIDDTLAPVSINYAKDDVIPHTENLANNGLTNDNTPTLVGSAKVSTTVTITDETGATQTAVTNAKGEWQVQLPVQTEGTHTYKATSIDAAGNTTSSTAFLLQVDTTAPTVQNELLVTDDVGRITGTVSKNGSTDDITPTISGKGVAGDTIAIYDAGQKVGEATVKTDGTWSFTPGNPGWNPGLHSITTTEIDPAGNTSKTSDPYPFTIDLTGPGKPTPIDLQDNFGDVKGQIALNATIAEVTPNELTDDQTPTYSGLAPTDAVAVIVFDNGAEIGTAAVTSDGKWTFTPAIDLVGREHVFTAKAMDQAGNTSASSDPWAFILNVDAVPPVTITQVTDDQPQFVGKLEKNSLTNDPTLVIDGRFAPSTSKENTYIVHVLVNGVDVGTTKTDAAGVWNFVTPNMGADGIKNITAYGVDPSGNKTDKTDVFSVVLDQTAPGASTTSIIDNVGVQTGEITNNQTTDDNTPTVTGKADPKDAGGTVTITIDGQTATAAIASDGQWTYTPATPLAEGKHQVSTQVTDPAGNTGTATTPVTFNIDTTEAPVNINYAKDDVNPHTANLADKGLTNDNTPTLVGASKPLATVTVKDETGATVSTTANAQGEWQVSLPVQTEGAHTYTATAKDATGNTSVSSSFHLTIDTTAPTISNDILVTDDVGRITGTVAKNGTTDDITPTITGKGVAGDTITIYDAGKSVGTAEVKTDGTWTFTPGNPGWTPGLHTITTTETDPAGNTSIASTAYPFTIDLTGPGKPTGLSLLDDFGDVKGQIALNTTIADVTPNELTDDQTPTYSGSAPSDAATVIIYDNGIEIATVPVDANGKWTYTPSTELLGAEHIFTSKAMDAAGNTSTVSDPWAFVLNIEAVPPVTITQVTDDQPEIVGKLEKLAVTNDPTLIIDGRFAPSTSVTNTYIVHVLVNGLDVGTTITDAAGQWKFTTPDLGADGSKKITAYGVNPAGNKTDATDIFEVTLDRTVPGINTSTLIDNVGLKTGPINNNDTTDDNTPTVTGQADLKDVGGTVTITLDGQTATALIGKDGVWTYTPTTPLTEGQHQVSTRVTDPAGNTGSASTPIAFTIDTAQAPVNINYAKDDVIPHTENLANNALTNDNTPTLVGSAKPLSTVTVTDETGKTVTAVTNAQGEWQALLPTQTEGSHTYTALAKDPSGNTTTSTSFVLNIDTVAPTVSTDLTVTDDVGRITGTVAKDGTTDDITPTISGKGVAGDTITIYDAGKSVGTAEVKTDGTWTFTPGNPGWTPGLHTITTTESDPAGNTSKTSDPYPFTIDLTGPGKPTGLDLQDNEGDVKGQIALNTTIADVTPNELTDDTTPTYSGSAPSDAASVIVYDNGVEIATVLVDANGKWTYTPDVALVGKEHIFTSKAMDAAGNTSIVSDPWAFVLNVDGIPPVTITQVTDNEPQITGKLDKTDLTNDGTLLIDGRFAPTTSTENTYIVHVLVNGVEIGTAKTDAAGIWSFTTPDLGADGVKNITAYGKDPVGNKTDTTDVFDVILDRTKPGASTQELIDNVGAKTGLINNNDTTDDNTPSVSGKADPKDAGGTVTVTIDGQTATALIGTDGAWTYTPTTPLAEGKHQVSTQVTDPAGNTGTVTTPTTFTIDTSLAPVNINYAKDDVNPHTENLANKGLTNDNTPVLVGSAKPLSTVTVTTETGVTVTAVTNAQGEWQAVLPVQTDGVHSYTALAKDPSGNTTASSPFSLTVDTTAPATPTALTVTDDVGRITGTVAKNGTTDDITPTISGKGVAGDTITVYDAGKSVGTAEVKADGTWTFTPGNPGWSTGLHTITTTETDQAGNSSLPSDPYPFTIDLTGPGRPTGLDLQDNAGDQQGQVAVNATIAEVAPTENTDDDTPTYSGSAPSDAATVIIYDKGVEIATVPVGADGKWTYTPAVQLIGDEHIFTSKAMDAAGNTSSASDPWAFVIDTAAPTQKAIITSYTDNVAPQTGQFLTGTTTNDTTPTVNGTIDKPLGAGEALRIYRNGQIVGTAVVNPDNTWTFNDTSLVEDTQYSYIAKVVDGAGNKGIDSNTFVLKIDSNPGVITVIATDADLDNKPVASGTTEPNSNVTITWPDGSQSQTTSDNSGNYSIEASTVQTSGTVTATSRDSAGNTTTPATTKYVDITNPTAPTVTVADPDKDNRIDATGTAEPGSTVTVTYPSGQTNTGVVGSTGAYYIESLAPETSGTVTASSTDKAGNTSMPVTALYKDVTAPTAPTVTTADPDKDNKIDATGTAEPGSTVTITFPSGQTNTGIASSTGIYSIESLTPETSGTVTASTIDKAGNTSPSTSTGYKDITTPTTPTVTAADPDKDNKIDATGTAEPGSTVTVTYPSGQTNSGVATSMGTYSIESLAPEVSGVVTASTIDKAGNTSPSVSTLYKDITAPTAPTVTASDPDKDNKIDATGTAEPGSTVTITYPSGQTNSGIATSTGTYSIESLAPETSGTVTASTIDKAGNTSPSASTVYKDTTTPTVPTVATADPDKDNKIDATGTAEPGSTVTVTFPSGQTNSGVAGSTGTYSIESLAPETSGTVTASTIDKAGNTSPSVSTLYKDTTAPTAPTVTAADPDKDNKIEATGTAEPGSTVTITYPSGQTNTGVATSAGTYSIESLAPETSGTVTASTIDKAGNTSPSTATTYKDTTAPTAPTVTAADPDKDNRIDATGTAEPGSTVTITYPSGQTNTGIATSAGTYSIESLTSETSGTVTASTIDKAGNTSPSVSTAYKDTTAPTAPTVTATDTDKDNRIDATGTAEPGSTVTITYPSGQTNTGIATSSGTYSIESLTTETSGTVTASTIDKAGNTSPSASAQYKDTTAPTVPTVTAADPDVDNRIDATGTAEPGSTVTIIFPSGQTNTGVATSTGTYSIESLAPETSGTVTASTIDKAGNTSPSVSTQYKDITAPTTPTVAASDPDKDNRIDATGTAEPGSTVTITYPSGQTNTGLAGADGKYNIESLSSETSGTVTAKSTDKAGNTSPLATTQYVDTTAPLQVTVAATDSDQDDKPTASGTAEAGSTVRVTWPDGSTSVTKADASGNYLVESTTTQTTGTVTAISIDAAGNSSPIASTKYTDITKPTISVTSVLDPDGDNMPTITGTTEPGAKVVVTWADGSTSVTTAGTNGVYSVESTTIQLTGTVTAVAQDLVGNISNPAAGLYTDKTAPKPPTVSALDGDSDDMPTATGTAEANSTVTITWPDGTTITTKADATGNYTIESLTIQNTGLVTATSTDIAGNVSSKVTTTYTDITKPLRPAQLDMIASTDTGVYNNDNATNDTTPTYKIMTPIKPGETPRFYVDGVKVDFIYDQVNQTLTPVVPLGKGSHNVQMAFADNAGNVSPLSMSNLTVIYQNPTVKVTTPIAGDGVIDQTESKVLTVSGTTTDVQQGELVVVTFTDTAGSSVTATAAVNAIGQWTTSVANVSALVDGNLSVVAVAKDAYDNTSTVSTTATLNSPGAGLLSNTADSDQAATLMAVAETPAVDQTQIENVGHAKTLVVNRVEQSLDDVDANVLHLDRLGADSLSQINWDALVTFDSNFDDQIDSSDSAWRSLNVWNDANSDATVGVDELLSLEQLDVSLIKLAQITTQSGDMTQIAVVFETITGEQTTIADAYLLTLADTETPSTSIII